MALVTDSTADVPRAVARERGIQVVPLTVTLDGKSHLDGVEIQPADFYRLLAASQGTPTTSQPSPQRFAEVYRSLLDEHEEVVSIHISARLSGTLAAAEQAVAEVGQGRVRLVDSLGASMALGLLVLVASQVVGAGGSGQEVVETVEKVRQARRTFFAVGTLEYLRRGGRIGRAGALLGSMLQIKPVLTLEEGEVAPLERVRTYERAVARVVELATEVDTGHGLCTIVGHASAPEVGARIAAALEPRSGTVLVETLGPVIGAHTGQGTVGLACYPAEVFPLDLGPIAEAAGGAG